MADPKCKICRRAGEKLFLKGEKCFTPKCAFERRPAPPGKPLAERKHRSNITEFGMQLREKQKLRNIYGVSEKQFRSYVKAAMAERGGSPVDHLIARLERRLDNVVYRLGYAQSRTQARQMVSHGHFLVGKKRMTIPSHQVAKGDVISVRQGSRSSSLFAITPEKNAQRRVPAWMTADFSKHTATITGSPKYDKGELGLNVQSVIEFYSR